MAKRKKGLRRSESCVDKALTYLQKGQTDDASYLMITGANRYSERIMRAIYPYPASDAAVVVWSLRNLADQIEKNNPTSKGLIDFLAENMHGPDMVEQQRFRTSSKLQVSGAKGGEKDEG